MRTLLLMLALAVAAWCAAGDASSQARGDRMGPLNAYLMDEGREVALAESAAPANISSRAQVLVLGADGAYRSVREGENGFVCLVERGWSSPLLPDQPTTDFWNPNVVAPTCYNAEGARTALQEYLRRTALAMDGRNRAEMKRALDADFADGRLEPPRAFAMSYMMSGAQVLGTRVGHYHPHVMIYAPYAREVDLGGNSFESGQPVMFEHEGGVYATIIVQTPHFITPTQH